jgi:RNA polymerase sigma-70 factor (ECF subfamily)
MNPALPQLLNDAATRFIRDRHLLGAFVGGLLRDAHTAEDVLQEVWLCLAAEIEKGTSIENQSAWCRGVARNLIRRHWFKSHRARTTRELESLEAFLDRIDRCFQSADADSEYATARIAALDQCVEALPERSRRLLALKYTRGEAVENIASEVGQSFEAVKKALLRIRAGLQDCVRQRLAMEDWL